MSPALEFRVLGPLAAVRDGVPVELRSPTQRALLAALLVHANAPVVNDVLVDAVWEARPPGRAEDTLRVHVSQLRKRLGRELVATVAGGYLLSLPPERLDSHTFAEEASWGAELLARGEEREAHARLSRGLERWRGEAYEDVRYHGFAQPEIRRLEELRLDALERRAEAAVALGRHEEAAAELAALVERHPHREGLWRQLMLALYRAGRQADALAAYRRARERLDEELGLEPGPGLRELERAILRHDPSLAPVPRGHANLPAPLTSFVGRRDELAETRERLARARLVTLAGPGGSGKTRLAVEVARAEAAARDAVWFVDLTPLQPTDEPAGAVIAALGREEGRAADAEAVALALGQARALVVLDNCEHVVERAAAFVSELLARCPEVAVLATSREPLRVPGEALLHVPPLAVGPDDGDAVLLFLERARDAVPDLALDAETRGPVTRLVRATAGIPLAIELAAARLDTLSLEDAAARAETALAAPGAGSRVAVPRHRTLHAALDWSRRLLGPGEAEVFRRLWVFRGGWALEALAAVCADLSLPAAELLERLVRLVETSMVQAARRGPEVRYSLLEPVRQYAAQLDAAEREREALLRRHAGHYRALALETGPAVATGDAAARRAFALEEANLVAAVACFLDLGEANEAAAVVVQLARWWGHEGRHERARLWTGRVLARLPELDSDRAADVLSLAVWNAGLAGDLDPPGLEAAAEEVLARGCGEPARARLLTQLGNLRGMRGDVRAGARALGAAHRILRARPDAPRPYVPLVNLACAYAWLGHAAAGERLAAAALELGRDDAASSAICLALLGLASVHAGRPGEAAERLDRALPALAADGTRFHHALATVWRGEAALGSGDPAGSAALGREALRLAGDPPELVVTVAARELLAWAALASGDDASAGDAVTAGAEACRASASLGGVAQLLDPAGLLEHRLGASDRSVLLLAASTAHRSRLGLARTPYEAAVVAERERELQRALGSIRFRELASEGTGLSLEEAAAALAGRATAARW